jgi:hypothetical protein
MTHNRRVTWGIVATAFKDYAGTGSLAICETREHAYRNGMRESHCALNEDQDNGGLTVSKAYRLGGVS